ncbi:DUF1403 family protein [Salipiger abyssi]|uniref:DUF1403 family protein n=1 Tax=Salipiger abyssi TaxID=1250539 RepID=UPI001A8D5C22|nr:DUF1403 family protein [Salipiger abyssi]MBN9888143.1 DUF1403 family protein [Salipiger abyssi]
MARNATEQTPTDKTLPLLPGWVTRGGAATLEDVAFLSGAALSQLHGLLARPDVPGSLLRDRLGLYAAEACVAWSGRPERAAELRDTLHLLRPGDHPGPAGEIYLRWRRAVAHPLSDAALRRAIPDHAAGHIDGWLSAGQGGPIAQAAAVLEAVLMEFPRDEATALILADTALARALRWRHVVPLLATGIKRQDLRRSGDALRQACHVAVTAATADAIRLAGDLARRVARLEAVAPKLRAKSADQAVALFLSQDAVSASGLKHLMSPRAARRLCDRLVALGAVRELTGRETFRLYGV